MQDAGSVLRRVFSGKACRFIILAFVGILTQLPSPAFSQTPNVSVPPRLETVDEAGVDLKSGQSVTPVEEINIGPSDKPVFSYSLTPNPVGGLHQKNSATPLDGGIYQGCIGMEAGGFWMPCATSQRHFKMGERIEWVANGSTTTPDGSVVTQVGSDTILTQRDGTRWTYSSSSVNPNYKFGDPTDGWPEIAKLKSVTYPNGEALTYTYAAIPSGSSGTAATQSIVSNQGYILHFENGSANPSKVKQINLSTEYCAASATSCAGSAHAFPKVEISSSGAATIVTDAMGRSTTFSGWTSTGGTITSPAGVDYKMVYQTRGYTFNGFEGCRGIIAVTKITVAGVDWNYDYSISDQCQITQATVSVPNGSQHILTTGSTVSDFVDGLGQSTRYEASMMCTDFIPVCAIRDIGPLWYEFPEDNKYTYGYDSRFNLMSVTTTPKPGSGSAILSYQASFDASCTSSTILTCNQPNYTIDANGNRTDYTYHPQSGGVATATGPADANSIRPQTRYSYTQLQAVYYTAPGVRQASGQPIWKLASTSYCRTQASCAGTVDEVVTSYTYDDNLRLVTKTVAIGDGSSSLTTTMQYDPVGNLIAVDGPMPGTADTTRYVYNPGRELVGTIAPDPDGSGSLPIPATRTIRDADGRPVRVDNGALAALPAAGTAPENWTGFTIFDQVEMVYNAYGQKVKEQKREGAGGTIRALTQYSYDSVGRIECVAVRMNPAVYGSLPASACSLGTQGSNGADRITKTIYDAAGQVLKVQKAYGITVANGFPVTLQQDYATYTYNANGKPTSMTDSNGNKASMTYDGFDRQVRWYFPSKTTPGTVSTTDYEAYTYDANGNRLTLRKRDTSVINYAYDALDRVTLKDIPGGTSADVYYSYDLRGLQLYARFVSASGLGITNDYDGFGRLTSTTNDLGGSGSGKTLGFGYDPNGNRTRITYPGGVYFTYDRDELGRTIAIKESGSTTIVTNTYDAQGRISGGTRGGVSSAYGYDGVSRLVNLSDNLNGTANDVTTGFAYNPASQVVSRTRSNDTYAFGGYVTLSRAYTTNGLNQYSAAGPATFTYDANGNLTGDGANTYTYDVENRLVTKTGGTGATLYYDPTGRLWRIALTGKNIDFLYDGDAMVYEVNGIAPHLYVHSDGVDDPLIWYSGSGLTDRRSLQTDAQGSIVSIADANGTAISINTYDEYGIAGAGNFGRFQYTGQMYIGQLGMYYYKARMYSPTLGRFLQTDPIGYEDQNNLYAYVGGDPINRSDPTGREFVFNGDSEQNKIMRAGLKGMAIVGGGEWRQKYYEMKDSKRIVYVNPVGPAAREPGMGAQPHTKEAIANMSNGVGTSVNVYVNINGVDLPGRGPNGTNLRVDLQAQYAHEFFDHAYKAMNGTLSTDFDLQHMQRWGTAMTAEVEAMQTENRWRADSENPTVRVRY